jgi:hypothetical protein
MIRPATLLLATALLTLPILAHAQACAAEETALCFDDNCLCLPAFSGDLATMAAQAVDRLEQLRAPVLETWLLASRNEVYLEARPIPEVIRQELQGLVPEAVLNAARYQVGYGDTLNLGHVAMNYGNLLDGRTVQAITLIDVILFRNEADARANVPLWLHELTHVRQFMDWGVRGFAERYVATPDEVEAEAYTAEQLLSEYVPALVLSKSSRRTTSS